MASTLDEARASLAAYNEIALRPLEAEQCALVVVDIQEKLLPPIFEKERVVRNTQVLIRLAGILKIPVVMSTQYTIFLLLRRRGFLLPVEASARQPQHPPGVRHRKPHLHYPDGSGGHARGIHRARRFRRREFAHGMELEDRFGSHAGRGAP
jgi:Isochorismatase family